MVDDDITHAGGFDWEAAEDITALSGEDLRLLLARLLGEERAAAYRHELLRGRVNLVRAELAGRGVASLPSEELARVLTGDAIGEATGYDTGEAGGAP